jgi:hypothetical protein
LAGRISICISAIGLLTSVVSESIRSKQQREEDKIRQQRLSEIVTSTQPLTSLSLHFQFYSEDLTLWNSMKEGEAEIKANDESTQGGVPIVPFEVEMYRAEVLPFLSFIAHLESPGETRKPDDSLGGAIDITSIAVLISLDDSRNAILSFGQIDRKIDWDPYFTHIESAPVSAGFSTSMVLFSKPTRMQNSLPSADVSLSKTRAGGSRYSIEWDMDPVTLANSIDKLNPAIPSTANVPKRLMVAILYDMGELPFAEGNFAKTSIRNLWIASDPRDESVDVSKVVKDFELSISVNGTELPNYKLTSVIRRDLQDNFDDYPNIRCTILEFDSVEIQN